MSKDTIERFLTGQNVLITGGSSGIGAACAVECAKRGANIGVNYRGNKERAEKVVSLCEEHRVKAVALQADISIPENVDDLFDRFLAEFQTIDVLVANAGIQKDAAFLDMSEEDWQKVISVNLTGQYFCAQRAIRIFCNQGVREDVSKSAGKVIHMSSVHDEIPWAGHVNYTAAKGGVMMLMESVAQEVAARKVRVLAVSPGAIKTSINKKVWQDEEKAKDLRKLIPYNRIGEPEDIAQPVAWLASDYADYITGTTLYIDGGMTLYPGFQDNG